MKRSTLETNAAAPKGGLSGAQWLAKRRRYTIRKCAGIGHRGVYEVTAGSVEATLGGTSLCSSCGVRVGWIVEPESRGFVLKEVRVRRPLVTTHLNKPVEPDYEAIGKAAAIPVSAETDPASWAKTLQRVPAWWWVLCTVAGYVFAWFFL